MTEDKRKRNVQWCVREIEEIKEDLTGWTAEKLHPQMSEAPISTSPYPKFMEWLPSALHHALAKDGLSAVSEKRGHSTFNALANGWAQIMLCSGATYEECGAFWDWAQDKTQFIRNYGKWNRDRTGRTPQTAFDPPVGIKDIPQTESVGNPVDRNLLAAISAGDLSGLPPVVD